MLYSVTILAVFSHTSQEVTRSSIMRNLAFLKENACFMLTRRTHMEKQVPEKQRVQQLLIQDKPRGNKTFSGSPAEKAVMPPSSSIKFSSRAKTRRIVSGDGRSPTLRVIGNMMATLQWTDRPKRSATHSGRR